MTMTPDETKEQNIDFERMVTDTECAYIKMTPGYRLVYANPYFYNFLGYTKEEFLEKYSGSLSRIMHQEDRQKLRAAMSRQLSMGTTFQFEHRIIRKDGTIAWISMHGKLVMEKSTPFYYAAVVDITSAKEAFGDLSRAKSDLDVIANNILGGILKISLKDFRIIYANDGFYQLSGYSRYEYENKFHGICSGVVHPEDLVHIKEAFIQAEKNHIKFSVSYRIITSSGEIRWSQAVGNYIGDMNGECIYLFIIVDITKLKSFEEDLKLEQTKHNLLCELNHEYVWEYDIFSHDLIRNGNLAQSYSTSTHVPDGLYYMKDEKIIHPNDFERFKMFIDSIESGRPTIMMDVRIKNYLGIYNWYKLQGITIFDDHGKPVRLIGKTTDIEQAKHQIDTLLEEATLDSLTKTLNREVAEKRIEAFLKSKSLSVPSALMMVDIRNCRGILTKYGRLFTDSMISEVAQRIMMVFPMEITGRIGMDVFIVFIKNIESRELLREKVEQLIKQIHDICSGQTEAINLHGCVGITISDAPNDSFASLFKKTDLALFTAKNSDGPDYEFYQPSYAPVHGTEPKQLGPDVTPRETAIRKYLWSPDDYDFISDCSKLLFMDEGSLDAAIEQVLANACRYFDVTQTIIVEHQKKYNLSGVTYSYFSPDSPNVTEAFLSQPYDTISSYRNIFDDQGLFYGNVSQIQAVNPYIYENLMVMGVKSCLQCAIFDGSEYHGYLTLDDCKTARIWSDEEIKTIQILTSMLGYVLLHTREKLSGLNIKTLDGVTGLPVFSSFLQSANQLLERRKDGQKYALISIDINKFHHYNINYGFSIGNKILAHAAAALKRHVQPKELFSRLENDLFYLLFSYREEAQLQQRLNDLIEKINHHQNTQVDYYRFTVSCGVYLIQDSDKNIAELIDLANEARLSSKNITSVHNYCVYSEQTAKQSEEKEQLRNSVRKALDTQEFDLYYQPGYDLKNDSVCFADATPCWIRQDKSTVSPEIFLPIMEHEGLSCDLDFYIIEKVCMRLRDQANAGIRPIPVSIHLSRAHLHSVYFVERVLAIIRRYRVSIEYLSFSIPENLFIDEPESLQGLLVDLKDLGFTILLDDFGKKYGSLRIIRDFPIDGIRFDIQQFQKHIGSTKERIIFEKAIETAKEIGLTVIVYNVDTNEQQELLENLPCDVAMGGLYQKALPVEMFEQYLI